MSSKSIDSSLKIEQNITEAIETGVYVAGSRLPPLRKLAADYGLSLYAMRCILQNMAKKKLIELRHGSGVYVRRKELANHDLYNITVFISADAVNSDQLYLFQALFAIQQTAIKHNCAITLRKRDYYELYTKEPPLREVIGNSDGIIFLGEYDHQKLDMPKGIPAVGIEMFDSFDGTVSPVSFDPIIAAQLAVKYFLRLKLKHIKVFYFQHAPIFKFRAECFELCWRQHGTFEYIPYGIDVTHVHKLIAPEPGAGLLFTAGSYCEDYGKFFLRETGKRLTDVFPVLSMDGKSLVISSYAPVDTITIDWKSAGQAAFDELLRRLNNPASEIRRICIEPKLVIADR